MLRGDVARLSGAVEGVDVVPGFGHPGAGALFVDQEGPEGRGVADPAGETHCHADDGDGFGEGVAFGGSGGGIVGVGSVQTVGDGSGAVLGGRDEVAGASHFDGVWRGAWGVVGC